MSCPWSCWRREQGRHDLESANLARLKAVGPVSCSQNGPVPWCHDYYFPDIITAAISNTWIIKNVHFGGTWLLSAFRELPKIAHPPAAHRPAWGQQEVHVEETFISPDCLHIVPPNWFTVSSLTKVPLSHKPVDKRNNVGWQWPPLQGILADFFLSFPDEICPGPE